MKLKDFPIQFPSDATVITEEVARFRALSSAERTRSIRGLINAGAFMMRRSPKAAFMREHTVEMENRTQQAVKEFISRHG